MKGRLGPFAAEAPAQYVVESSQQNPGIPEADGTDSEDDDQFRAFGLLLAVHLFLIPDLSGQAHVDDD